MALVELLGSVKGICVHSVDTNGLFGSSRREPDIAIRMLLWEFGIMDEALSCDEMFEFESKVPILTLIALRTIWKGKASSGRRLIVKGWVNEEVMSTLFFKNKSKFFSCNNICLVFHNLTTLWTQSIKLIVHIQINNIAWVKSVINPWTKRGEKENRVYSHALKTELCYWYSKSCTDSLYNSLLGPSWVNQR